MSSRGTGHSAPDSGGSAVLQRGANGRWSLVDADGGSIEADAEDFAQIVQ